MLQQNCENRENATTAYFSTIDIEVERRLKTTLAQTVADLDEPLPNVVAARCYDDGLREVTFALCETFSPFEQNKVVCHVSHLNGTPPLAHLMQSFTLRELSDRVDARWIQELLAADRLTTFFQPIVNNAHPEQVFGYECLLRGIENDGGIISPLRLIAAARNVNALQELDHLARLTSIKNVARLNVPGNIFVNFSPCDLASSDDRIYEAIQAVIDSGLDPSRFVCEVVESDQIDDIDMLLRVLDIYRDAGFRIALDDVGAGYNSLNRLADIKPDYVKFDLHLIRGADRDRFKGCITRKLLELSRELGFKTVVEGIETHDEWRWARRQGADFAQGYLFARPAAVPPKPEVGFTANAEKLGI